MGRIFRIFSLHLISHHTFFTVQGFLCVIQTVKKKTWMKSKLKSTLHTKYRKRSGG